MILMYLKLNTMELLGHSREFLKEILDSQLSNWNPDHISNQQLLNKHNFLRAQFGFEQIFAASDVFRLIVIDSDRPAKVLNDLSNETSEERKALTSYAYERFNRTYKKNNPNAILYVYQELKPL